MRLVLASNNTGKLAELKVLLGGLDVQLVPQGDMDIAEAAEPHGTFVENALAKARHAARAAGGAALADDSGLCVPALGGAPGVHSAVFAGAVPAPSASAASAAWGGERHGGDDREARRRAQDAANNALLLQHLAAHHGDAARHAYFACTLVAVRHAADPEPLVATGRWPGTVLAAPRGSGGFGYDPLMFIPALAASVAELPGELKNRLSHRAQAARLMRQMLAEVWQR